MARRGARPYDLVGNILSVENAISQQPSAISSLGGSSKYTYEYDELNRLIKARGTFEGTSNKADYELNMQYNRLNGIVQKALKYTLNGQDKGYTLDYEYNNPKHPHAPSLIANSQSPKARSYQYDGNGNPTYYDEFKGFRSMVWDEENRLRGINDNGRLHLYTYDHTGERALKSSAESSMAVINGLASAVITHTEDYTAYVSPYFVVNKGKFTKHYFEGSSRIVSKLGEGTFSHKNTGIMAGGLDYLKRTQKEQEARDKYIRGLNVPPGPPTQHGIYATPEWTKQPYPSIDWEAISQNQEPPEGWPRYPKFNEPGDVPGPPVQFGPPVTNANVKAGYGFIPNGVEEKNLYYYHPDHLGSSSYITDKNGEVIQHTEYMAFGEVLVDEHSTSNKQPYLFNGKELDFETGLYYYGARYYDAKTSLWLNTDPLSGYNPILETEHYIDGQHNGGIFNPMNMATYSYTYQNPIRYIDPNGKQTEWEQVKIALKNPSKIMLMNNVGNIYPKITNKFVYRGATVESKDMILTRQGPAINESDKDRGSQLGAMRHTLWMAISTSRYSKEDAKWAGDIHEGGSTSTSKLTGLSTINVADRVADEMNNIIGRNYGDKHKRESFKDIAIGVLGIFYNDGLYTIEGNEKNGFNVVKTKISEKQYNQLLNRYKNLGKYGDDLPGKLTNKQKTEIEKFIKNGTP